MKPAAKKALIVAAVIVAVFVGCRYRNQAAPPDAVVTFATPRAEIHLTHETWGRPNLVDDDNWLVAHLVVDGKDVDRKPVIMGGYMEIVRIDWPKPDSMVVCVKDMGEVHTIHPNATLEGRGVTRFLKIAAREGCVSPDGKNRQRPQ